MYFKCCVAYPGITVMIAQDPNNFISNEDISIIKIVSHVFKLKTKEK